MRKTVGKWDRLGVELKNFMKDNLNSDNRFDKSVSQLLKEFSEIHRDETTFSSTIYYYYNDVKPMLEDDIRSKNSYYESVEKPKIVEVVEVSKDNRDEVLSMINYIESRTDYTVSDDAKVIIEEMIDNLGVIETLISIFDSIENFESINIFDIIVRNANEKPLN